MKYLSKLILCGAMASLLLVGCDTNQLHNLNINPQAVNQIDLNFLFTPAQLAATSGAGSGDNRFIDWRVNIGMCSYAIQHLANGQQGGISPGDTYTINYETNSAPFQFLYGDELSKLTEIIKQTSKGGYDAGNKQNLQDAARILRVFLFARLTDYYGSVPYSEAEQATEGVFFPKYDKQKDIYTALLAELDAASADLDATRPDDGFSAADLYYKGNIAQWKRWGYSLMLRLAMKISNVDLGDANTYVAKAIAGGVFTSNADNINVPMALGPSQWINQNGLSRAFFPGDGGQPTFLSRTLVRYLKGPDTTTVADDDPRLMIISGGIGQWSANGYVGIWNPTDVNPLHQLGMPNGMNAGLLQTSQGVTTPNTVYSKINPLLLKLDDPYMLMNYGEVQLLLAEAAERGIGGATGAATYYQNGVNASFNMYTAYDPSLVPDATAITNWWNINSATYGGGQYQGGNAGLNQIATQLWVNHFLNWWEAWGDWRRTGLPALTPVNYPGNITGGTIPVRLMYPSIEVANNPNFGATATTPNLYTTKVWWAGGPE